MTTTESTSYRYTTCSFANSAGGQKKKLETIQKMEAAGWEVTEETVQGGQFSGGKACCMALICLPLAFTAYKNGSIVVSFRKPR